MRIKERIKKIIYKCGWDLRRADPAELNKWKWLQEMNINTILDIGANVGNLAILYREIFPTAEIYSFEPVKKSFDILNNRKKNDSLFHSYNVALGSKNGKTILHHNEYDQSSSLKEMLQTHKEIYKFTEKEWDEEIEERTLNSYKDEIKIKENLLVSMEVQGLEKEVIENGMFYIEKAKILVITLSFVQLYKNQPLFDEMYRYLYNIGFSYEGSYFQSRDPRNGKYLQSYCFFLKR